MSARKVTQTKPADRSDRRTTHALRALGLGRPGRTQVLPDDARTRSLITQAREFVRDERVT